ncbi:phosphate ABC transporter substrate-binding protein (PhoT family) [Propionicimonas paludicola]|uniref:Phosphate ABC transporter substrate-binding protein (PhoT family) n=2 Tax=Propionicimonas paludicola TaxID=185243 RepID=A0A2A9CRV8_9ACTN|nr:phosphate ABC transporter substrate-binding protein (PhoT family) [Propionicimonas paludicola]
MGLIGLPFMISVVSLVAMILFAEAGASQLEWVAGIVTVLLVAVFIYPRASSPDRPQGWVQAWLPVLIGPAYFLLAWLVVFQVEGFAFGDSYRVAAYSHAPFLLLLIGISFVRATMTLPLVLVASLVTTALAFGIGSWRRAKAPLGRLALAVVTAVVLALSGATGGQLAVAKANADQLAIGTVVSQEVDLSQYQPFSSGNRLVSPATRPSLQLNADFPVLDGATAAYPIYAAMGQAIYQPPVGLGQEGLSEFAWQYLSCNNTSGGYQRLIDGEADVFFGAQPSKAQQAAAQQAGRTLKLTPIGREAFVIFVSQDNPVSNLSSDQVRAIYTRQLTNWKQVGGTDEPIIAFQRPQNSGSQTIMEAKVMQGRPMAAPLKEENAAGMGDILSSVADYRNSPGAIGYSFRWYATVMNAKAGLKLLSIDGVAPSVENIRNGSYPFTVEVHAVTAGTTNSNVPKLIDWVRSAEGQALIEQVGYVGLG